MTSRTTGSHRAWRICAWVWLLTAACGRSTPTSPTVAPTSPGAPTLACPASIELTTEDAGLAVTYDLPVAEGGVVPVTVSCTPASGEMFPAGATAVRCTATDARGQTASCGFTVSVARLPTLSATRFLAFGDSVTYGIIATENPAGDPFYLLRDAGSASYPSVLAGLLAERYATQMPVVVNAGKGGEKAVDGVGRFSGAIDTHRPDIVLLLDGYNDLGLGEAGIDPGLAAVNDMVKVARFRGVRVLIATLTPPNRNATRGLSNPLITAFNDGIRAIARGEDITLVDLYAAMSDDPNRYNSDDQRHPNEAGYRKIAETFADVIRAELERR